MSVRAILLVAFGLLLVALAGQTVVAFLQTREPSCRPGRSSRSGRRRSGASSRTCSRTSVAQGSVDASREIVTAANDLIGLAENLHVTLHGRNGRELGA